MEEKPKLKLKDTQIFDENIGNFVDGGMVAFKDEENFLYTRYDAHYIIKEKGKEGFYVSDEKSKI